MNKKIYKYKLEITPKQEVLLPKDAKILSIQVINNELFIYCVVNPDAEKELRVFKIVNTGGDIYFDMGIEYNFIGTFRLDDDTPLGYFIGHLFEQF